MYNYALKSDTMFKEALIKLVCAMAEGVLRMARKCLEGAAVLRQETLTQPFTKRTDKRADELISASLNFICFNQQTVL
mgnify:CR=1 FL=1